MNTKKTLFGLFFAFAALLSAQSTNDDQVPAGYVSIPFGNSTTVVPTLDTALTNWTKMVQNVSILSLVNEGLVTPSAVAAEVIATANVFCAEAAYQVPGCNNIPTVAEPYKEQILMVFGLVPASQWSPKTFSDNIPVYAAAFIPRPTPPAPPPSSTKLVGNCYSFGGVTMCYPAAGTDTTAVKSGPVTDSDGKKYLAHIGSGLMGPSLWFEPVN